MTDIIRHRGPDRQGLHINSGIGLGVRRLSIIDLDSGDQPISNENGTLTVICNGEIYNYIELRKELLAKGHRFSTSSDVEVIVHLYEEHGAECVRHLRGMFTFALWDAVRNQLMLARDRLGIKPLNYAISHDALYFGSEIKSVLISDHIERQIDVHSLNDIFSFGFAIAPKTLFKRIQRLLRRLNAAVTMCFHASIFAISQSLPVVGIDYYIGGGGKVKELFQDLGRGDDIQQIDELESGWLVERLRDFVKHTDSMSSRDHTLDR
jgi:asparagine synthase (glutamine-hydrolysing)